MKTKLTLILFALLLAGCATKPEAPKVYAFPGPGPIGASDEFATRLLNPKPRL